MRTSKGACPDSSEGHVPQEQTKFIRLSSPYCVQRDIHATTLKPARSVHVSLPMAYEEEELSRLIRVTILCLSNLLMVLVNDVTFRRVSTGVFREAEDTLLVVDVVDNSLVGVANAVCDDTIPMKG